MSTAASPNGRTTGDIQLANSINRVSELQKAVTPQASPEANAIRISAYFAKEYVEIANCLVFGRDGNLLAANGNAPAENSPLASLSEPLIKRFAGSSERFYIGYASELSDAQAWCIKPKETQSIATDGEDSISPSSCALAKELALSIGLDTHSGFGVLIAPILGTSASPAKDVVGYLLCLCPSAEPKKALDLPLSSVLSKVSAVFEASQGGVQRNAVGKKPASLVGRLKVAALATLCVIALLAVTPWTDRVSGTGELNFAENYRIATGYTAGEKARVKNVFVTHGQVLEPGQKMFELEDDLLSERMSRIAKEYAEVSGKIQELRKQLVHHDGSLTSADRVNLQANLKKLYEVDRGARQELENLQNAQRNLTIRSPLSKNKAIVTGPADFSDYTKQSFGNQDFLATVGNMESDLLVYGYFNEEDLPRILEAVRSRNLKEVKVSFYLSDSPEVLYSGTIRDIDTVSKDRNNDEKKEILIRINIGETKIPYQDDAANGSLVGVTAQVFIDCERTSLLTLLTRSTVREVFWKPLRSFF